MKGQAEAPAGEVPLWEGSTCLHGGPPSDWGSEPNTPPAQIPAAKAPSNHWEREYVPVRPLTPL